MATATVQQQARRRTISLAAVAIGCAALTAVFAAIILKTVPTTGHWYYPLDDTYIDMSIAKHLALHGVWGTSSQFASAASSPGYICLLAICYRVLGVSQYTPLVLAFAASIGVVFVTARILRGTSPRRRLRLLAYVGDSEEEHGEDEVVHNYLLELKVIPLLGAPARDCFLPVARCYGEQLGPCCAESLLRFLELP